MRRVLDSSVGFKWLVAEADTDKALRLRDDFCNGLVELLAPDVFPVERSCRCSAVAAAIVLRISPLTPRDNRCP